MATTVSKTVTLPGTGDKMPTVAFGTWTVWQTKPGEVEAAVTACLDSGYRHVDCAWVYKNEAEVGQALASFLASGKARREDIFVTTKVWDTYHSRDRVKLNLQKSLELLKLSYVDLALIHWPVSMKDGDDELFPKDENGKAILAHHDLLDTWKGMEDCVQAGLVRNIGLSNFNSVQIQRILDNSNIKPCNLQIEINPTMTNQKLVTFAKSKGLTVSSYAPIGAPGRPWQKSDEPCPMQDPVVTGIASKKGKSPAQVILRWHLQRGLCLCIKSVNADRIRQNIGIFDFELSEDEMAQISGLNQNFRMYAESLLSDHPEYPFHVEF